MRLTRLVCCFWLDQGSGFNNTFLFEAPDLELPANLDGFWSPSRGGGASSSGSPSSSSSSGVRSAKRRRGLGINTIPAQVVQAAGGGASSSSGGTGLVSCPNCDKKFTARGLPRHLFTCNQKMKKAAAAGGTVSENV